MCTAFSLGRNRDKKGSKLIKTHPFRDAIVANDDLLFGHSCVQRDGREKTQCFLDNGLDIG